LDTHRVTRGEYVIPKYEGLWALKRIGYLIASVGNFLGKRDMLTMDRARNIRRCEDLLMSGRWDSAWEKEVFE
jgi:hypothetical protein